MAETLRIKNFGPVTDVTIELRLVNVLIGDQSTGKSTVAKVLIAIKGVMIHVGSEKNDDFLLREFYDQMEYLGISSYLKPESFIEFEDSIGFLKFDNKVSGNKLEIKEKLSKEGVKEKVTNNIRYIPSYREAVSLLKDETDAIIASGAQLPKLFHLFSQLVKNAKRAQPLYDYRDVLNVFYKYAGNRDLIIMPDKGEIAMNDASSALNSGIPLLLAFDYIVESIKPQQITDSTFRIYHTRNQPYIVIEEPELNCFPTTQKKMVSHIIDKIKYWNNKEEIDFYCRILITTHSPYFLTSLNNLMYAYVVGEKYPVESNRIIDEKYWLNPDDVSAYLLKVDGTCENIMDRKEKLIKAEKIDTVSREINEEFEKLTDLEFAGV